MHIPAEISLIRERRAGVQDEGSQLVASAFAQAAMNQRAWLDLCAGPGGKAALISSLALENGKEFVANEISPARARLVEPVCSLYIKRDDAHWSRVYHAPLVVIDQPSDENRCSEIRSAVRIVSLPVAKFLIV